MSEVANRCCKKRHRKTREIQDEHAGVDYLLASLKKDGIFAKAYNIGFVIHPQNDWLGASPDRLLYDGTNWKL